MREYSYKISEFLKLKAVANEEFYEGESLKTPIFFQVIFQQTNKEDPGEQVGSFCFEPFPECGAIVVSTRTHLSKNRRSSKMSNYFRSLKNDLAIFLGYRLMVCTIDLENLPAVGNAMKSNYRCTQTFSTEGKKLSLWVKQL